MTDASPPANTPSLRVMKRHPIRQRHASKRVQSMKLSRRVWSPLVYHESCEQPPLSVFHSAHARSLGLGLVTNNTAEFGRVKGLTLENWTLPIRRSRSREDE